MTFQTITYMVIRSVCVAHRRSRIETRAGSLRMKEGTAREAILKRIRERNEGWNFAGYYLGKAHLSYYPGGWFASSPVLASNLPPTRHGSAILQIDMDAPREFAATDPVTGRPVLVVPAAAYRELVEERLADGAYFRFRDTAPIHVPVSSLDDAADALRLVLETIKSRP